MSKRSLSSGSLQLATAVAVLVLTSASAGWATDLDMAQIPVTNPNLCLTCHLTENPGPGAFALNLFGEDFLANGRVWDSTLAQLDSDDDGCLNGVEVGDSDGDGQPDGNVDEQAGNPGVDDECGAGSLVDERTWGALKAMFDGR